MARRRFRRAARLLIVPVNYWRAVEYRLVLSEGGFEPDDRVLDVGSPKLLSIYLADRVGCRVTATDIDGYFLTDYDHLRRIRRLSDDRYQLAVQDGRNLEYDDASFTHIYSISVLEHIPDDGDTQCVRELARVLEPGGRCILTVPYWPTSRIDYRDNDFYWAGSSIASRDGRVFFQRRYTTADLHARIIGPSGLHLTRLAFVGERSPAPPGHELSEYLPPILGPLHPLISALSHTAPVDDVDSLLRPLCALIVLEKPAGAARRGLGAETAIAGS